MGIMSQIAAEKEDALNAARLDWQEAFCALVDYQAAHPPAHRKPHEIREEARLDGICIIMKSRYSVAESERYRL